MQARDFENCQKTFTKSYTINQKRAPKLENIFDTFIRREGGKPTLKPASQTRPWILEFSACDKGRPPL